MPHLYANYACHLISVAGHDYDHVLHHTKQHDHQVGRDEGEVGDIVHPGQEQGEEASTVTGYLLLLNTGSSSSTYADTFCLSEEFRRR